MNYLRRHCQFILKAEWLKLTKLGSPRRRPELNHLKITRSDPDRATRANPGLIAGKESPVKF